MCYAELQGSWDEEPDLTCYARSHFGTSPLPGLSSFMFWSILHSLRSRQGSGVGSGKVVGLLNSCSLVLRTNGPLLCGHNGTEPCRTGSLQSLAGSQLRELLAKVLGILQVVVNQLHH